MSNTISGLLELAPDAIFDRGENYYHDGMINTLTRSSDHRYHATVSGSMGEDHTVFVETDSCGHVTDFGCDCPYDHGDICKHLVAVFLAIQKGSYKAENSSSSKSFESEDALQTIVSAVSATELQAFMVDYAKHNDIFKRALLLRFAEPDLQSELAHVKEQVRQAIRRGTHRGMIDYRGCDSICGECMSLLEAAETRLNQGHFEVSFYCTLHILISAVRLASYADSSSGYLTDVIDRAMDLVDNACETAKSGSEKQKKLIYIKLLKEAQNKCFDGWSEWSYRLLRSATRFVTQKNVEKLYAVLDILEARQSERGIVNYYLTLDKLVRLEIIRRLEGDEGAEKYIESNLEFDAFRKIAISNALEKENYLRAEALCLEKLKSEPLQSGYYMKPSQWLYLLYEVYTQVGDDEKRLQTAEKILLQGDLEYYTIMKALLIKSARWKSEYPILRQKCSKLPYHLYMQLLDGEEEWVLLLEQVCKHPESVFTYGKQLAGAYSDIIYPIYCKVIMAQVEHASDRRQYAKVCASIRQLHDAGGILEAKKTIEQLQNEYNRRPAMLDELRKLTNKLKL